MTKNSWLLLCLTLGLSGCRQTSPDIKTPENIVDGVADSDAPAEPSMAEKLIDNTQVVTAESAMAVEDAPTAEDKAGAVAVKTEF